MREHRNRQPEALQLLAAAVSTLPRDNSNGVGAAAYLCARTKGRQTPIAHCHQKFQSFQLREARNMTRNQAPAILVLFLPLLLSARPVIATDSVLVGWGSNGDGQSTIPQGLGVIVQIAAGEAHSVVLRADGTVRCWGWNPYGQCDVPADLPAIRRIDAGYNGTIALGWDGRVRCWGANWNGECDIPTTLENVTQVAGGGYHNVALRSDGVIVGWGWNGVGQISTPPGIGPVKAIGAGHAHTLAVREDGTVWCWGRNDSTECNVPPNVSGVVEVSSGGFNSLARGADGTAFAWGNPGWTQGTVPPGGEIARQVAGGHYHSMILRPDRTVVTWGGNWEGQGVTPPGLENVAYIAAGGYHNLALLAADEDGDGIDNTIDNCVFTANPGQSDIDGDGIGDDCDGPDSDGDGVTDALDGCPLDAAKIEPGLCGCGEADVDADGDGVCDSACPADLNGDGVVGASDLPELLNAWGATGPNSADIDSDGLVGPSDLSALLALWGTACMPTIDSVQPAWGPVAGGTTITITGRSLTGATSVMIGGVAASAVTVVNPTTLTAVTPSGAAGPRDVVVTTPGGSAPLAGGYAYVNPVTWATVLDLLPDPAVVFDADVRARIVATGYPWRVRDGVSGIEMLLIPPGSFEMGCSQGSNSYGCALDELPAHPVTLTKPFYIGRFEVKQSEWNQFMDVNPSFFQVASGYPQGDSMPVEQVSWAAASEYLARTGLRFPTEAEWEYAARAGTQLPFHSGPGFANGTSDDTRVGAIAWLQTNALGRPQPVGLKAPNGFGLHDTLGNAWEWVGDYFAPYSATDQTDPTGPSAGTTHPIRGGSWVDLTNFVRCSMRHHYHGGFVSYNLSFRVARDADGGPFAITGVAPGSGTTSGGTTITITGPNFVGTTSVTFGGVPATAVTLVNANTLTVVTPAQAAGVATVSVTTPLGTTSLQNGFIYSALTAPSWATLLEPLPNATVVTDATLRNAIIATGHPWRVRDNGTDIEMVLVPAGSFDMGCIEGSIAFPCDASEQPVHEVALTNPFYMSRYEVTQAQWRSTMGSNPSYFVAANGYPGLDSRPVENISWDVVQGFLSTTGMRLPTEAEWEYACRAGTTTPFHSGPGFPSGTTDDSLRRLIAWGTETGVTQPVGARSANALGLHDMLGNVWEWCSDWYGSYPRTTQVNPVGPSSGTFRVVRGGGVYGITDIARSSFRVGRTPDHMFGTIGLRVVRSPD